MQSGTKARSRIIVTCLNENQQEIVPQIDKFQCRQASNGQTNGAVENEPTDMKHDCSQKTC